MIRFLFQKHPVGSQGLSREGGAGGGGPASRALGGHGWVPETPASAGQGRGTEGTAPSHPSSLCFGSLLSPCNLITKERSLTSPHGSFLL